MNRSLIKWFHANHPDVTLVMASKYLDKEDFQKFIDQGVHHFGENRVESFLEKKDFFKEVHWHFIGTLQSKKVKKVINHIDVLHTLDRESLVSEIEKYRDTPLPCMIQCNISNEPNKHGVDFSTLDALLKGLEKATKIEVIGVMGMAEESEDVSLIESQFKTLKEYLSHVKKVFPSADALSMGMSQDYPVALKLGATHVRLGRILLEETDATA